LVIGIEVIVVAPSALLHCTKLNGLRSLLTVYYS